MASTSGTGKPGSPLPLTVDLRLGNCLDTMASLDENSVDAIVTDPPYGLSFLNKKWDYDVPSTEIWAACLRVLKPGGHLLAFAGTRTQHRMAVKIEDGGFHIRDMMAWMYGTGFPKSLDVSKAIDKELGATREEIGTKKAGLGTGSDFAVRQSGGNQHASQIVVVTAPATAEAQEWAGWGTALKPAIEPITLARKPFAGNVAQNMMKHGTAGLNIDACRVGNQGGTKNSISDRTDDEFGSWLSNTIGVPIEGLGRWPTNLLHDGSPEVMHLFPRDQGGSTARFFYHVKASRPDRDAGLKKAAAPKIPATAETNQFDRLSAEQDNRLNTHSTVKPTALMAYLVRLVTPPGGLVMDPFMGSGSTGKACMREGFNFLGMDMDPEYIEISRARIEHERRVCAGDWRPPEEGVLTDGAYQMDLLG